MIAPNRLPFAKSVYEHAESSTRHPHAREGRNGYVAACVTSSASTRAVEKFQFLAVVNIAVRKLRIAILLSRCTYNACLFHIQESDKARTSLREFFRTYPRTGSFFRLHR